MTDDKLIVLVRQIAEQAARIADALEDINKNLAAVTGETEGKRKLIRTRDVGRVEP